MVHPLLSRTWSCSSCAVTLDVVATFVVNVRVVGVWGNGVNSTNPAGRFSVCSRLACATASVDQLSNPLMRFFTRSFGGESYLHANQWVRPRWFSSGSNLLTGCQRRVAYCRRNRGTGRRHPMDRVNCGGPDLKLKADRATKDEVRLVQSKWDRRHVRGPCPSDPNRRGEISREDHECHSRASVIKGHN